MKRALFLVTAVLLLASCTKTKTKTNTVTVTNTDTVSIRPDLIGTWTATTATSPIVFTASTYQIQSLPAVTILATADTIYDLSEASIVHAVWAYSLSIHNDTLTLTGLGGGTPSGVYIKN